MKRLLAFAASNSSTSINQALLSYAVEKIGEHDVSVLDIRDYPLPIYGKDLEVDQGIPENFRDGTLNPEADRELSAVIEQFVTSLDH